MIEKIEKLIEQLSALEIEDEDLKSDLDLLVNGSSTSDLSLTTLLAYLNNDTSIEDTYEELFKVGDDNDAGITRGL